MGIKRAKILPVTAIIALAFTLGAIGVFSYLMGWQWLDSDHASEMMLGQLLSEENTLLSARWLYSTELRIIYQSIFTMPLFKLLGSYENWALIRSINIVLNNIVLILSYFFLVRQMGVRARWMFLCSFLLLLPLSFDYWNIVLFGGYYTFFIAQLFLSLGLFIRLIRNRSTLCFILFALLSFALGVQSIRSFMAVYIPLFMASAYLCSGMKEKRRYILLPGFLGLFFCMAGYLVNKYLHLWYSFYSFEAMETESIANVFQKLFQCLMHMAGFFGFAGGIKIISPQGLFGIAAVLLTFAFLLWVYKIIRRRPLGLRHFLPLFFVMSMGLNIFILVISSTSIIFRYFIPFMILYVPITALFFEYAERAYSRFNFRAILALLVVFFIGQGFINFYALAQKDINSPRKAYLQYLMDEGLSFGFATFWNANVSTELSNGRIRISSIEYTGRRAGQNVFIPGSALKPKVYDDPAYFPGESFLLLSLSEWSQVRSLGVFSGMEPAYRDADYVVVRYPSTEVIFREILGY